MRETANFYRYRSKSQSQPMDPLSDVVSLLRPHDCVAAGLDAGGDWSVQFDRHAGLKCNAVLRGACWLKMDGMDAPKRLDEGDCAILPHGRPFVLSARPMQVGINAAAIYAPVPHGGTAIHGGGGAFFMTGARFLLSGLVADALLRSLPPVIVVRPGASGDAVRWSLAQISEELREDHPGRALSVAHLSHYVFMQVLRCHLAKSQPKAGWLTLLADHRLSQAVKAMHDDPAQTWRVDELAKRAGLSRTSFAVRFRRVAGEAPMAYLTRLRMLRAAEALRRADVSVSRIAAMAGYASESAFTAAFKRNLGSTPRQYASREREKTN